MKKSRVFVIFLLVIGTIILTGCTQNSDTSVQQQNSPQTAATVQNTVTPTQLPADAPMWDGNLATINQYYYIDCSHNVDTTNIDKFEGVSVLCPDGTVAPYLLRPGVRPYSPSAITTPTAPLSGASIMKNDPIVGSYVFDPSQFKSSEVERMEYFSSLGSAEYGRNVVPLDISPDIKWTFRDDGVLIFTQNVICNGDSPRCQWKSTNGAFLRNGTWQRSDTSDNKITYTVERATFGYPIHEYTIVSDKNGVHMTQPNSLNMTKVD